MGCNFLTDYLALRLLSKAKLNKLKPNNTNGLGSGKLTGGGHLGVQLPLELSMNKCEFST
jgi:hypothetical protein